MQMPPGNNKTNVKMKVAFIIRGSKSLFFWATQLWRFDSLPLEMLASFLARFLRRARVFGTTRPLIHACPVPSDRGPPHRHMGAARGAGVHLFEPQETEGPELSVEMTPHAPSPWERADLPAAHCYYIRERWSAISHHTLTPAAKSGREIVRRNHMKCTQSIKEHLVLIFSI